MATAKKADTAQEAVIKAAPKVPAKPERLIYVGPTLRTLPFIQNRVYTSMPPEAEAAFAECPPLRLLFIPLDRYPIADEQLRNRTGAIFAASQAAAAAFRAREVK